MDYNKQNAYLYGALRCANSRNVSRNVSRKGKEKRKAFQYELRTGLGQDLRVCRKFVEKVFQVSEKPLKLLQTKKAKGILQSSDRRGRHGQQRKVKDVIKESVRQHIRSFPAQESHYSRHKNEDRKYLPEDLNLSKMYRLYLKKNEEDGIDRSLYYCSQSAYRSIFRKDFNIKFGRPRTDTCAKCDKLFVALKNASSDEVINEIMKESEEHHLKAEKTYAALKQDTTLSQVEVPDHMVIAIDLEQVLYAPNLTHSNVFYQRQLSVYNFGVHFTSDNSAVMSIWNETVAGRGASEVCSCLLKVLSLLQPGHPKNLVVWSDACGSQNRNWFVITLWLLLVQKKVFHSIEHKFMISGHSFLPADRDFAQIERKKKTAKVLLPEDWGNVISEARVSKPFTVIHMTQECFKDFEVLTKALRKPKSFKLHDLQCIRVDEPGTIKVKKSLDEEWTKHVVLPTVSG